MSSLVAQHQLTSYATPIAGGPGTASVVLGNDNATVTGYNAHDADTTIHVQDSALASRPAALTVGRKWMSTDVGAVYLFYDNGSSWVEVNYQRTASTGAVTITSTTTPQLTVAYDGSHSATFSVSAAGLLTVNATTTITITPAVTLSAQPILSTLTASQAVFTDSSKGLVSNAITGTGNVVMSASPTLTGTISAAALTLSGVLTYGGVALNAAVTGTGNMVLSASPTLTGTTTAATLNATTLGGTLSTAAQPNVTSVGTLTVLAVAGTFTVTLDGTQSIFAAATAGANAYVAQRFNKSDGTAVGFVGYDKGQQVVTGSTNFDVIIRSDATGTVLISSTSTRMAKFNSSTTTIDSTTTAVQALTATTIGPSGTITSTASGLLLDRTGATTAAQYQRYANTSGAVYLGVESNTGGSIVTGTAAYDVFLRGTSGISFSANDGAAVSMRIASNHAVSFAAGISATTGTFSGALSGITTLAMSGALSGGTTAAFSSQVAVNTSLSTSVTLTIGGTATTTGTTQAAVSARMTAATSATTRMSAFDCLVQTQASAVTYAEAIGFHVADAIKGATSVITTQIGLLVDAQTQGATNYAIWSKGGNIRFDSLPTSSAGLASGTIWANSNVLTVVP